MSRDLDAEALALVRAAIDAARAGNAVELERLLSLGVPASIRDHKGNSLVMLASYHGHQEAVRVLAARGAELEAVNDRGQTPLQGVAFKGDVAMAELLLSVGAQVDGGGEDGKTPLMFASMFNRAAMVELLLRHGADPSRADAGGATARVIALGMGALSAARALGRALGFGATTT